MEEEELQQNDQQQTQDTTTPTTEESSTPPTTQPPGAEQQDAQLTETDTAPDEGGPETEASPENTPEGDPEASAGPGTRPVAEGETLASIALELFGDAAQASVLQELNPDIQDPNNLAGISVINVPNADQIAQFREAKALEAQKDNPPPPVDVPQSTQPEEPTDVEVPPVDEVPVAEGGENVEAPPVEETAPEVPPEVVPEPPAPVGIGTLPAVDTPAIYPVVDTTRAQDETIIQPVPTVTDNTEVVTAAAAETATKNPPTTSPEPTTGETVLKNLHDGFFGPWSAVLTPFGLGGRGQARAAELGKNIGDAWNKIGSGDNAAAHIRDVLDLVYTVCDGVTGFTGPLGTILGIASYIRYIPFPATIAIGNWMKVVSEFLNTLTFILDVVKVVTGALKVIFGAIAIHHTQDPALRAEYRKSLSGDIGNLIADGFSVGFTVATGGHRNTFTDGWKSAGKGMNIRGAFQATHGAIARDTLGNTIGLQLFSAVNRTPYFANVLGHMAKEEGAGIAAAAFNEAIVKPFVAAPIGDWAAGVEKPAPAAPPTAPPAPTTPAPTTPTISAAPVQQKEGSAPAPSIGALAALSTAAPAPTGGRGASIRGLQARSRQALLNAGANSTTPVTDAPLPPSQVTRSPLQLGPIAEEKAVLKATEEELLQQKAVAEAGIAENAAWSKGADEHIAGLQGEKAAIDGASAQTAEDKALLAESKAKVQEGKAESQKGSSKAGEAENGPGGAPGDASTDVPWYKKPFVWIIRKLNQAKSKVMEAITKAIMKALENVMNFDDLDAQLAGAEEGIAAQEAVVNEEPNELAAMSGQLATEETSTMQAKAEAEAFKAENEAIKASAESNYESVKAQREAVEAEETAIKTDTDGYATQYGPTFEEMKELSAKQQAGEISPLRLQLDERRAILEEMLVTLETGVDQHAGGLAELVSKLRGEAKGNISAAFGEVPEQKSAALGSIDEVEVKVSADVGVGIGQRKGALAELRGRVMGTLSGEVTTAMLQQVNALEAEIVAFAEAMDAHEAEELAAVHASFASTYDSLSASKAA